MAIISACACAMAAIISACICAGSWGAQSAQSDHDIARHPVARILRGPVAGAAAPLAVAAAWDTAVALVWLPSPLPSGTAGSENPTMTWRVTPLRASIATRRAGAMGHHGAANMVDKRLI